MFSLPNRQFLFDKYFFTAPASSSGSADGVGNALPSGTASVNYSVVEVPGSDGGLKIITVNY